jgi:preprotein translocase subunit SecD
MGSGPVRGFAVTLGLGIITSVFTAIFVTRLLIIVWFERSRPREIKV